MPNKIAYVICSNDYPEFVHPGPNSEARAKLEELAKEHYDTHKWDDQGRPWTFTEYSHIYYWHIHEVPTV